LNIEQKTKEMTMNTIEELNAIGQRFIDFALPMLIQSSVLILLLLVLDLMLRRRVRAVVRYAVWMLVLVKLVLPTDFSSPTGLGQWLGPIGILQSPQAVLPTVASPSAMDTAVGMIPRELRAEPEPVEANVTLPITPSLETFTTPAAGSTTLRWPAVVLAIWVVGVLVLTVLVIQRVGFVLGLVRQAGEAPPELQRLFRTCGERMGLRRIPSIKLSPAMVSPAACGLRRPAILIPESLPAKLNQQALEAVLLHELAHLKRGDLWVNLIQTILQIAYFYNPLLWLANAVIRRVREQAVDEMVLVAMNNKSGVDAGPAGNYAQTLVEVAKLAFAKPALSLRLIGVVESKSALRTRIKHILSRPIPKSAKLGLVALAGIIVLAAILLPMAQGATDPNFVIRGTVRDAVTGKPIAGAKVSDDGYGRQPNQFGMTDSDGKFQYKSWREEHNVKAEAPGYQTRQSGFTTSILQTEKEKVLDFILTPQLKSQSSFLDMSHWKVIRLPQKAELRLVALGRPGDKSGVWWSPDGTTLEGPPYWERYRANWHTAKLINVVEVVYPGTTPPSAKIGPAGEEYVIPFMTAFGINPPEAGKPPSLKVGFGFESWKTVGRLMPGEKVEWGKLTCRIDSVKDVYRKVPEPSSIPATSLVTGELSDLPEWEAAIVAVETSGRQVTVGVTWHPRSEFPAPNAKWVLTQTALFKAADLDHFDLRVRPRHWVTFTNFATRPNSLGQPPVLPDQEEPKDSNRRPFLVTGKVTDAEGKPMPDVEISVSAGMGSLIPTGRTATNTDGTYILRFGGGRINLDHKTGKVRWGLQAATISPHQEGYYEKNLHRQGDLRIADELPKQPDRWARPDNTVLPGKPFHLDFIMVPAARIEGRVLDKLGKVPEGYELHLSGKELPPSCSAIENIYPNAKNQGRFTVNNVPLKTFRFDICRRGGSPTTEAEPITFSRPGLYQIELIYRQPPAGKPSLTQKVGTKMVCPDAPYEEKATTQPGREKANANQTPGTPSDPAAQFQKLLGEYNALIAELDKDLTAYRTSKPMFANFSNVYLQDVLPLGIKGIHEADAWIKDAQKRGVKPSKYDEEKARKAYINILASIFKDVFSEFNKGIKRGEFTFANEQAKINFQQLYAQFVVNGDDSLSRPFERYYPYPDNNTFEYWNFSRSLGILAITAAAPVRKMVEQLPPTLRVKQDKVNALHAELIRSTAQTGGKVTAPPVYKEPYLKKLEEAEAKQRIFNRPAQSP